MSGSPLYDSTLLYSPWVEHPLIVANSFKFPTLTTSKRPGSNTLYSWQIRFPHPYHK